MVNLKEELEKAKKVQTEREEKAILKKIGFEPLKKEKKGDYKPSTREVLSNNGKVVEIGESQYQSFKRDGMVSINEDGKEVLNVFEEKLKGKEEGEIFTRLGQAKHFYEQNPYFYDSANMFWLWSKEESKYIMSDDVDILNAIMGVGVDIINSKSRTEIIHSLKSVGREKKPKDAEGSWVQFKEKIIDFKTGKVFDATPDYFMTSPIPWSIGDSEETPVMDKLFREWVGEENVKSLYQIIAYVCSKDQFMQRLIALVGGGSNGKGSFCKLLVKFIGKENMVSSELRELSSNNFETASLYKKQLCVMGEISADDLKNTNQIKKLAGEDQIRYCFKGKNPFTESSQTTIIAATNSLPKTPDKTLGFYRKWYIRDFPNQFEIQRGIIDIIPKEEYNNLAKKYLSILKELYENQTFHNEGDFDDRIKMYEERSDPLMRFVENNCEENNGVNCRLRDFANTFNKYAKENHFRIFSIRQISKALREEGFEIGKRKMYEEGNAEQVSSTVILNFFINKKLLKLPKLPKSEFELHGVPNTNHSSSGSSGSSQRGKVIKTPILKEKEAPKPSKSPLCSKCGDPNAYHNVKGKSYCKKCFSEEYFNV